MLDIRINVTGMGGGGLGGDQGLVQEGGQTPHKQEQGEPQPRQGPGGAIAMRIKMLTNCQDDTVIGRELDWQSRAEGDQAKSITFRDQAVNQTTLRAFAFMKGKSSVVHMAHSVGQFFGTIGTTSCNQPVKKTKLGTGMLQAWVAKKLLNVTF